MSNVEKGGKSFVGNNDKNNLAFMEKKKIEEMNNKLKLENSVKNAIFKKNNNLNSPQNQKTSADKRNTENTDSRFSNFVRGFRREHTDFFPSSKRHSAIFSEQLSPIKNNSPQKVQRSSAIFQRNRAKGEPILTDFIPKRDNTLDKKPNNQGSTSGESSKNSSPAEVKLRNQATSNNNDFLRMRREKTESVIFVSPRNANSAAVETFQHLQQQQQVKEAKLRDFFSLILSNARKSFFYKMNFIEFFYIHKTQIANTFLSLKHVFIHKKQISSIIMLISLQCSKIQSSSIE